ncbi:hypothetical protein OH799_05055 [Nocardia sp. NBC_00881]|nr:hypothetical protein OH799_05055 [Nocardia sp. NBC_00881]
MLHIDHKMMIRVDGIEGGLLLRRQHAEIDGWHGEIEGLDLDPLG